MNIKKIVFVLLLCNMSLFGQVGVGTVNPKATLDIVATDSSLPLNTDGLLIPRISSFPLTNPTNEQNGMLVQLTGVVGSFRPGFYYWDSTSSEWKGFNSQIAISGWDLLGNSGTTNANFIGTTDSKSLIFKVNNQLSGRIDYGSPSNTSFGYQTLFSNTTGYSNTVNGYKALFSNTSGDWNIANSPQALYYNTTGSYNVGAGNSALYFNTTGSYNVGAGHGALRNNKSGEYNIAIGALSGPTLEDLVNTTSIGYKATANASNMVRIGNSLITVIEGNVAWSNPSDARIKRNIQANVPGLTFINSLRPVTYTIDNKLRYEILNPGKKYEEQTTDYEKIVQTGFIAQEVEAAANKIGYEFDGVNKPKNNTGLYSLSYATFVVPLVKAVQEQQVQNEELRVEIEKLKLENERLKNIEERLSKLEKLLKE